ncbi:MAG: 4Fe-4S binding protein [Bacteroidales bacterium]|nr:4Fe-4S binding protein [Bacteroidales bacterium]
MKGGFRYEIDKCVSCLACVAACKLINGGSVPWRQVLTDNRKGYPGLPVHNLSLACNHCEDPACLNACPAAAYSIDPATGAVLLSEERCIGCNYCFWSCPFDAPQLNRRSGTIEKCHFCVERQENNIEPACTSACPTGALSFDKFESPEEQGGHLPVTGIKPRIRLNGSDRWPVKETGSGVDLIGMGSKISPWREWTLILFTYLTSGLFGLFFAAISSISFNGGIIYPVLTMVTLLIPVVHLGKPSRAWRALTNISKSELSREIVVLLIFAALSNISLLYGGAVLFSISFAVGLVLLVLVDNVYTSVDSRIDIKFHPGTVFLTGLLMASLFSGEYMPLIFISSLQVLLALRINFSGATGRKRYFTLAIFTLLMASGILFIMSNSLSSIVPSGVSFVSGVALIMAAQALNRIGFYFDFKPPGVTVMYHEKSNQPAVS